MRNYPELRPHKNASIKMTDNTITKRKKVLNFLQRQEIIAKKKDKDGYGPKICKFSLATDSLRPVPANH